MRKITLLFAFLFGVIAPSPLFASEENTIHNFHSDPFIFMEDRIEFAVYPDGQFDFFIPTKGNRHIVNMVSPHINISYNAGYNYAPFIQYDDFGAVVQIEHVPIYYDYYGRIIRAGDVSISYNSYGRISRIGGLHLHYNPYHRFTHATGFINIHNTHYTPRPWHKYYRLPGPEMVIVYQNPYRAYYHPNRMGYQKYVNHYKKQKIHKRAFYRPGDRVSSFHRGRRTAEIRSPFQYDRSDSARNHELRDTDSRNPVRSNLNSRRNRNDVHERETNTLSRRTPSNRSNATAETGRNSRSVSRATRAPEVNRSSQPQQKRIYAPRTRKAETGVQRASRASERNTRATSSRSRGTSPAKVSSGSSRNSRERN